MSPATKSNDLKMTHELAGRAYDLLVHEWHLDEDDMPVGEGEISALEHLIHEISHAVSLGMTFNGPDTVKEIGRQIGQGKGLKARAIAEETRTWAIEWNVWQQFELGLEWGDLADAAAVQEVSEVEVHQMIDHWYIREMANEVYMIVMSYLGNGYTGEVAS